MSGLSFEFVAFYQEVCLRKVSTPLCFCADEYTCLEIERGAANLIEMDPRNQSTTLHPPPHDSTKANARKIMDKKVFTFDNSFWSFNRNDDHYADQDDVYDALGEEFLDHNFEGYHTCIFAYVRTSNSI